eukprot:414987_1
MGNAKSKTWVSETSKRLNDDVLTKIKLNAAVFDVLFEVLLLNVKCPASIKDLIKHYTECNTLIKDLNFESIANDIRYLCDHQQLNMSISIPTFTVDSTKLTHFIWDRHDLFRVFNESQGVHINYNTFHSKLTQFFLNDQRKDLKEINVIDINTLFNILGSQEAYFKENIRRREFLPLFKAKLVDD